MGSFRIVTKACAVAVVAVGMMAPTLTRAETLADALVGAYNTSGLLEQNRALLRAADEDVASAAAALKPILRWTADATQRFGETTSTLALTGGTTTNSVDQLQVSVNLIAELLLYDFGSTRFRVEAAKETVLATRQALISLEQQILLRAVAAYMGVLQANEFVALRQNNVRLLTQELRAARDRFQVGEVTRTDVALAEAQLAQAQSGLAGAQGDLLIAREEYRAAVGNNPGQLSPAPRLPSIEGNLATAKALAVRRHPDLLAAQYQVAAAELAIRSDQAAMSPRITLNGSYGLSETFNSNNSSAAGSVGVSVGQTIYGGGALSSQVRRSIAQRDAQRGNLINVARTIENNVGSAYARLSSARAVLASSDGQIRAARIAFQGVREEATLGARTTLDVLDAEQSLLDAESARVTAQSQLYVAAYTVLSSTGQLTARDLRLPVQVYDAAAYYNLVKDSPAVLSKQGQKLDRVLRALQKE